VKMLLLMHLLNADEILCFLCYLVIFCSISVCWSGTGRALLWKCCDLSIPGSYFWTFSL